MSHPQFNIINNGEREFLTVYLPGRDLLSASDDHPNYASIRLALDQWDLYEDARAQQLADLFSVERAIASRFTRLSERVAVGNGRVYFDGDECDESITQQIVRFLDEGEGDWQPLVKFMENVAANPTEHSRVQLYDWLRAHDFTITTDGCILGYKGVTKQSDGSLVSGFRGTALVDGERITGQIPNEVGSVVEMPRSAVAHDPGAACSTGLHVGTFRYAKGYASGAMLQVKVNPRDVVSVPTDARGEKVRVCRYEVLDRIEQPQTQVLYRPVQDDYVGTDEYGFCDCDGECTDPYCENV